MSSGWQRSRERDAGGPGVGNGGEFDLGWIARGTGHAERRQVIVLAVGFEPVEASDPEDLAEAQSRRRSFVVDIATRHGGTIGRVDTNLQIIAWGWPCASEVDARLAVAAALEISARPSRKIRCGIDVGIAVTVDYDRGTAGLGFVGEMVAVAVRLQSQAAGGQVLASRAVAQLVDSAFEFRRRGRSQDHESAFVVERIADRLPHNGTRAAFAGELVGRQSERTSLAGLWEKARSGAAQVVKVEGEAGVGCSALLRWLAHMAWMQAGIVIAVQCRPELANEPLVPIRRLAEAIIRLCSPLEPVAGAAVPIGIDRFDGDRRGAELAGAVRSALQPGKPVTAAAVDALAGLVRYKARRPLLLLVEDVHWADAETARMLALLHALAQTAIPLLVVATARPQRTQAAGWATLQLPRLGSGDIRRILLSSAHAARLDPETVESIVVRSGGFPMHAAELARLCSEHADADGHDRLLMRPNRLNSVLAGRLDALAALKPLVQAAAIVGHAFDAAVLAAAFDVEERAVSRRLDLLVDMGLLSRLRGAKRAAYQFDDALFWSQAYWSVVKARRRQLHRKIAGILEAMRSEGKDVPAHLLAYHWKKAGQHASAFGCWVEAAIEAVRQADPARAAACIREALAEKEREPAVCPPRDEAALLSMLGAQLRILRGSASIEAVAAYERATELLSRMPGNTDDLDLDIASGLATIHLVRGNTRAASEASSRMLSGALERGSEEMVATALGVHGTARLHAGFVAEAIGLLETAVRMFDPAHRHDRQLEPSLFAVTLAYLASAQALAGNGAAFHCSKAQALLLSGEGRQPHTAANVLGLLALGALILGERGETAALARASFAISSRFGYAYYQRRSALVLAWSAAQFDPVDGTAAIRSALDAYRANGARRSATLGACLAADIAIGAGKAREALDIIVPAKGSAERMGDRIYIPEILRITAVALVLEDEAEIRSARSLLDEAEAMSLRHGSGALTARIVATRSGLGRPASRGRGSSRRGVSAA